MWYKGTKGSTGKSSKVTYGSEKICLLVGSEHLSGSQPTKYCMGVSKSFQLSQCFDLKDSTETLGFRIGEVKIRPGKMSRHALARNQIYLIDSHSQEDCLPPEVWSVDITGPKLQLSVAS